MKLKKIMMWVLLLFSVFYITGCESSSGKNNDEEFNNIETDENSNIDYSEEIDITGDSSSLQKNYLKMEVRSNENGEVATYDVDNYAIATGEKSDLSNNYYFVKDNILYYVNSLKPKDSKKVLDNVKLVLWDSNFTFVAVSTSETKQQVSEDFPYLTVVYSKEETKLGAPSHENGEVTTYGFENNENVLE